AGPGLAITAAALCAVALWPTAPDGLALGVEIQHRAQVRGHDAAVGDVVTITARGGDGERAIWVYRDEQALVLRCPGAAACAVSGAGIAVDLALSQVATYTIVAVAARAALPVPSGSYDDDIAAARRDGIAVREDRLIVH